MKGWMLLLTLQFLCFSANAKLIQILHTNDIHSFFEYADHDKSRGGYAALKTLIDKHKSIANDKGIPSLVVDAGDFMEGHGFYMADYGRKSFEMHNKIGYDVVTIGNHDYLMGTDSLDELLGDVNPSFAYLGANLWAEERYENINEFIKPFHEFEIDGMKIGFLGLTTDEIVFKWRMHNGGIERPYKIGKKVAKKLKERGNDIVIALTHLGFKSDKKLVKKAEDIDLVIGGHSHESLFEPFWQKNKKGKKIPIVQAGKHAEHMGKLIIDVDKSGDHKIISYELIPIYKTEHDDEEIKEFTKEARLDLEDTYGKEWLYEKVGFSDLKKDKKSQKIWNFFITDAVKESVKSEISIHTPSMSGSNYPIGEINRFDIMNSHPRWFEFDDEEGWAIYRAKLPGFLVKPLFKIVMNFGLPLTFTGVEFKWKKKILGKGHKVSKIKINGKRMKLFKMYEFALPEGIIRGARGLFSFADILFKKTHRTSKSVFQAIEEKLSNNDKLDSEYLENNNKLNGERVYRTYFPGRER